MKGRQWVACWVAATAASGSFAALAATGPMPTGQAPSDNQAAFHTMLLGQARKVAASGQPLDLLAAAWLASPVELPASNDPPASPSHSDAWLDDAIRLGSDQPMIARAAVMRCLGGGSCDIPAAIQTLQTEESDDVGAQLLLWRMHAGKGDTDAAAQAWARATQATRYADEVAEGVALLDHATRGVHWPAWGEDADPGMRTDSETIRAVTVFALVAASWMPGLGDAHRQCPADVSGEQRQRCRHLFKVMADSNAFVTANVGVGKMRELSDDAAERQSWEGRKRELMWLAQRSAPLLSARRDDVPPLETNDYLQRVGEKGELPAIRQLLADNGIATQPPADWEPAAPGN